MCQKYTQSWWKLLCALLVLGASVWAQSVADVPGMQARAATADVPSRSSTPSKPALADNFVIGNEDVLSINVWKEADISRVVPVRSDGKISLPLVGELQAAGKTPKQLETEIASGLKSYISEPEVTVIVQEIRSQKFNILGHVQKPGSYLLTPPMTVVDAIAIAGGFRDFAKVKSIYVLRDDGGKQVKLPFNYKKVIKGSHPEQNIQLQPRDTIVIP
jgi:polysaccharide biosynthesis/export protein